MAQIVADDFNRADGAIGANWTNIGTGNEIFTIISNKTQPHAASAGEVLMYYSGSGWASGGGGADQYAEAKATGLQSGKDTAVAARVSGASLAAANAYLFVINSDDVATGFGAMKAALYKQVAGAFTALTADIAVTVNANDVIRVEVSGSSPNIAVTGKINGVKPTGMGVTTETSLASGNPGLYVGSGTTSNFDDFAAGDVTAGGATPISRATRMQMGIGR